MTGLTPLRPMVEQGLAEAKDVIALGPGKSFDHLFDLHKTLFPEKYVNAEL